MGSPILPMNVPETVQYIPPSAFSTIAPNSTLPLISIFSTSPKNPYTSSFIPSSTKPFIIHHPACLPLFGPSPSLHVLASSPTREPFAHEAPVYWHETNEVFFCSSLLGEAPNVTAKTFAIKLDASGKLREVTNHWSPALTLPNGAIRFEGSIVWCCQGLGDKEPSALVASDPITGKTKTLVNNFFGRAFNSLNDVAVLPPPVWAKEELEKKLGKKLDKEYFTTASTALHGEMGSTVWFTDPNYGHEQNFKNTPQLPNQVYCFNPHTGSIRVVADGFIKPNGIAFNLEGTTCYITDTAFISGKGVRSPHLPGTIYAFDVIPPPVGSDLSIAGPTLSNRRVFAFTDAGGPDGIKCDRQGNVYAGCFDGLHIWSPQGSPLGRICFFPDAESPKKSRGCANFCLVPGGIVMCAEDRLYFAKLNEGAVRALL